MRPFFTIPLLLGSILLCFLLSYGHTIDLSHMTRQILLFPAGIFALLVGIEFGALQDEKDIQKKKREEEKR